MSEKTKQTVHEIFQPTNTEINPETGVLKMDEMLGQTPPAQPDDTLYTLDNGEYTEIQDTIEYPAGTKFYFRHEDGTYYDSNIEIGPDAPAERPDDPAAIEHKAPLAEAESLLAWLKTQPSTPENKAMRAQAGIVVDYLKAE
jgi:hypothetical protein